MYIRKKIYIYLFISFLLVIAGSCSFIDYADSGQLITGADDVRALLDAGYVLVDAQRASSYGKGHIAGAVNVKRKDIIVSDPVPNSLAPADVIARVMGGVGVTETSDLVIYDDNLNMDSSRLLWSLKIWGHQGNLRVVSGGLPALLAQGYTLTEEVPAPVKAVYKTSALNRDMIAEKEELLAAIDNPPENYVLIDVRTDEEFNAGYIPGAVHINHERNMFVNEEKGTTFRPVSHLRIFYKEKGILPEDEIVVYCKSSVRAANTYVALTNAGYPHVKVYDGAWLEWSAQKLPSRSVEVEIQASVEKSDNS